MKPTWRSFPRLPCWIVKFWNPVHFLVQVGRGMARDEDLTDATTASDSGTWIADCSARFAKTAEDTVRVGAAMADRWPAHTANILPTPASEISTPARNPDAALTVASSQPTTTLAAVS